MLKKKEFIILIGIVLAATLILLLFYGSHYSEKGILVVTLNGSVIIRQPLSENFEQKIETSDGSNTIVIQDGKAGVISADCSNQICVQSKAISKVGETIACLPHHLLLEIKTLTPND